MKSLVTSLRRDTRGATSIEYALICAMIFLAMVVALQGFGAEAGGVWSKVSTKTTTAMADAGN